jgi:hypothetical protein
VGEDSGIDHNQSWLRFPYDSTFLRSHYLHPHPYAQVCGGRAAQPILAQPPSQSHQNHSTHARHRRWDVRARWLAGWLAGWLAPRINTPCYRWGGNTGQRAHQEPFLNQNLP